MAEQPDYPSFFKRFQGLLFSFRTNSLRKFRNKKIIEVFMIDQVNVFLIDIKVNGVKEGGAFTMLLLYLCLIAYL